MKENLVLESIDCQPLFENCENYINPSVWDHNGTPREVEDVSNQRFPESRIFSSDCMSCVMNKSSR